MKAFLTIIFLTSFTTMAADKKLEEAFTDSAVTELGKVWDTDEVVLGMVTLKGKLEIQETSEIGIIKVKGNVYGETHDYEFGDPVDEVEAVCKATMIKIKKTWKTKKIVCK